ncbi:heme-dependent oxidative N-demethylase family protein [Parahaliea aestuarii]|uniref:DUF3445 domain-containing protein n=1 Tax=Parahaliea aestuarii TaxID=1852021 RepID=A0A5C9A0T1_9GAMM|nr:DUF3445 domain-containing protein [Parahaliea aestuarii]TXS94473.1 DUF3445 domain-containing protein [Parahaliea aestuarii]
MLFDNCQPRYLPHLSHSELLQMGLVPMAPELWIEPDGEAGRYHLNKLAQRSRLGDRVYRELPESRPAQEELSTVLLKHLLQCHADCYRREGQYLYCLPGGFRAPLEHGEALWNASLWVADDLVIMEPRGDSYTLTAASLCAASQWRLEDKVGGSLADIHAVIPGFDSVLLPKVERFFQHLKVERPVVRYNWSLQHGHTLNRRPGSEGGEDEPLFYRVERQSLRRLPASGAVVFTIRVYLHPLSQLVEMGNALPALLRAIDSNPPGMQQYKGFDRMAAALAPYRRLAGESENG